MKKVHLRYVLAMIALVGLMYTFVPGANGPVDGNSLVVAATETGPSAQDRPIESLRSLNQAFVDIAREVKPAVVTVFTERRYTVRQDPFFNPFMDFFGGRSQQEPREYLQHGLGSGVIVKHDGYILTNYHVVDGADSIFVRTEENSEYSATVIGSDPKTDIAVIKIDADNLPTVRMGNSDELQVGEIVLAVGSPMSAELAHTVTQGIVSAKGRSDLKLAEYEDFIQTDAAINPGNSGGALVNLDGELVGINSAIVSRSGGFQGIGFAVPVNMAVSVMNSLLETGRVVRGWLGVSIQDLDQNLAAALNLKQNEGALIGNVLEGSPAESGGLKAGDIILAVNGRTIRNSAELKNRIAATSPGSKVNLTLLRDGSEQTISVELGELPGEAALAAASGQIERLLGFQVGPVEDQSGGYGRRSGAIGVLVVAIDQGSNAYRSGLRQGDIIRSVNRQPVNNVSNFESIIASLSGGETVLMRITRDNQGFFLAFRL